MVLPSGVLEGAPEEGVDLFKMSLIEANLMQDKSQQMNLVDTLTIDHHWRQIHNLPRLEEISGKIRARGGLAKLQDTVPWWKYHDIMGLSKVNPYSLAVGLILVGCHEVVCPVSLFKYLSHDRVDLGVNPRVYSTIQVSNEQTS